MRDLWDDIEKDVTEFNKSFDASNNASDDNISGKIDLFVKQANERIKSVEDFIENYKKEKESLNNGESKTAPEGAEGSKEGNQPDSGTGE